jgi:hypothetical protein
MTLYDFYWDSGKEGFLAYIDADAETVKRFLEEYRKGNEWYDNVGFLEFLACKGVKAELVASYSSNSPVDIDADEHIPF